MFETERPVLLRWIEKSSCVFLTFKFFFTKWSPKPLLEGPGRPEATDEIFAEIFTLLCK